MIGIIEDRETNGTLAFATSEREIALAIATAKLMDSERNIEILRVLNDVFDSLECESNDVE